MANCDNHFDFDRRVARQLSNTDRGACMATALTVKHPSIALSQHRLAGLLYESNRRNDKAGHFQYPLDPIEVPDRGFQTAQALDNEMPAARLAVSMSTVSPTFPVIRTSPPSLGSCPLT
jgi:hypothetical protein